MEIQICAETERLQFIAPGVQEEKKPPKKRKNFGKLLKRHRIQSLGVQDSQTVHDKAIHITTYGTVTIKKAKH